MALANYNKDGWERTDFPIVCETCLGDNPYIRMMKAEFDKECKVCARPFTVFRWKPGSNARYKKTEICQTCAKLKNVCQVCLLDLEFNLPVQVRDSIVGSSMAMPQSDVNREYFAEQAEKQVGMGGVQANAARSELRNALSKLARTQPYFKRNTAHVCSFWLKGECTRGETCPYRHEKGEEDEHDPELAHQNIKDRYYGKNDPVAAKILNKPAAKLVPPVDPEIKTLFISGLTPEISEQEIRDVFQHYGDISSIKLLPQQPYGFVTYRNRKMAEEAAEKLYNNLTIRETFIKVAWGRPQTVDGFARKGAANPTNPANVANPPPSIAAPQQSVPPPQQQQSSEFFSMPTTPPVSGFKFPSTAKPTGGIPKPIYPSMNPTRLGSAKRDR